MSTLIKAETKTGENNLLLKENIPAYTFSPSAILKIEKEILGIYVSAHPLSIYRQKIASHSSHGYLPIQSHHIGQLTPGRPVLIGGLLVQTRRQFTKHHEVMAFLLLEDEAGFFEAIAFPDIFNKYFSLQEYKRINSMKFQYLDPVFNRAKILEILIPAASYVEMPLLYYEFF